jgi:hypothetical protein
VSSLLASPLSVWVEKSPVRRERWLRPELRAPPPLWSPIDSSAASRPEPTDQVSSLSSVLRDTRRRLPARVCLADDFLVADWIPQDDPVGGDTELADLWVMGARP